MNIMMSMSKDNNVHQLGQDVHGRCAEQDQHVPQLRQDLQRYAEQDH